MYENNKEVIEHLKRIEYLLAGILLMRKPNLKEVAKAIKCSDKTLTAIFPERVKGKKEKINLSDSVKVEQKVEGQEERNFG